MRDARLITNKQNHISSRIQEVSGSPECPPDVTDKCRAGHPRTPENTYTRGNGRRDCRVCQARTRKSKRHATGQSVRFNGSSGNREAVERAALQAFQALTSWSGGRHLTDEEHEQICDAWQALGDAFGWPGRGAR